MSKRFSPTAIGMFVVGSFALLVAAIVVVGSGKMFQKPVQFVCFFPGGVNGLKVGAPVKFRGVQIGNVARIQIALPPDQSQVRTDFKELRLPIILDIDSSQLRAMGGTGDVLTEIGFDDIPIVVVPDICQGAPMSGNALLSLAASRSKLMKFFSMYAIAPAERKCEAFGSRA